MFPKMYTTVLFYICHAQPNQQPSLLHEDLAGPTSDNMELHICSINRGRASITDFHILP